MELKVLSQEFTVCKLNDLAGIDWSDEFCFLGKTDEELSLVCSSEKTPADPAACDPGWKAFRIEGTLDFSLIGILAKLSGILAENKIGIFAISTYNTDYILTKKENFDKAIRVLADAGYKVGH